MNATTATDTDRDPLDVIAEEFADRCRRGETPAVSEYLRRFPDLAEDLEALLPTVGQMESWKRNRRDSTPVLAVSNEPPPTRLGDFRILGEIGRGGMGIVYEAVHESLGRRVAVKVLPAPARHDSDKRGRFLREAQAAARLHHTHIVPVFGVGEQDGMPYYVMQFIRGCGLDDLLTGWRSGQADDNAIVRPNQWRGIAAVIQAAAAALHYAHEQGVLHRDVKPGNLLLDHRGHLWVTDFGLAKMLDQSSLTATGTVLGTVQYMAPEAFHGKTDARTDVFGLGMTLYELLAGRLPFADASPGVLLKQIAAVDPPAPHTFNRRVPMSLELIALKAVAREPNRRYVSAEEMADDLDAYLHGRPITARRLTWPGRGLLWCRRNPVVAGLSAATALALGSSAGYSWGMYRTAEAARANEVRQRKDTEDVNTRLQANLDLSLAAIEKLVGVLGDTEMPPPPGTFDPRDGPRGPGGPGGRRGPDGGPPEGPGGPGSRGPGGPGDTMREQQLTTSAAMTDAILAFYEKYAESNATTPTLTFTAARAYRHAGAINSRLGRQEKAANDFKRSIALLENCQRSAPEDPAVGKELAIARAWLSARPSAPPRP